MKAMKKKFYAKEQKQASETNALLTKKPERVDKEDDSFLLEDLSPIQNAKVEKTWEEDEAVKRFVVPQILSDPLYPQKSEEILRSLEMPYQTLDAKEKMDMLSMLPTTQGLSLKNLGRLFYAQDEKLDEEEKEKKREILQTKEYIKKQLQNEQEAMDSGVRLNPLLLQKRQVPANEAGETEHAQALPTHDASSVVEREEALSSTNNDGALLVGQKEIKLKDSFGYQKNSVNAFFSSLFLFSKKTLNEELQVFSYAPKVRLLSVEIPFFFAIAISFMLHITWPHIYALFANHSDSYLYNFLFSHLTIQGLSLSLPLLFLLGTHVIQVNKIFGQQKNQDFSTTLLLLSLSLPLGIFCKSLHNLFMYFCSMFNLSFHSAIYPNPSAFFYNQSSFVGQLFGFMIGLLLPALLQGLFFRGILLGHLLSRGFGFSAVVVLAFAAFLFEWRSDYVLASFLMALGSGYVRKRTDSLNLSILFHLLTLAMYHFSNQWVELLSPNTSLIHSLSGDRILQSSFLLSILLGLLFYGVYVYFKNLEKKEKFLKKKAPVLPPPFSVLFLCTAVFALVVRFFLYFG